MKCMRRRQKGFTLVELLIVVAILGILAAVVIPSVLGLMGRGSAQAYETDQEVIQLAAAAFYSDVHGGLWIDPAAVLPTKWQSDDDNRNQNDGHYFPTAIAFARDHMLKLGTYVDPENVDSFVIMGGTVPLGEAIDVDIDAHAIWMGLLVNAGEAGGDGLTDRGLVAPLATETALYLQEIPQSAAHGESVTGDNDQKNGAPAQRSGGYCWIVGQHGRVYGAYYVDNVTPEDPEDPTVVMDNGGYWFAGFGGSYP